MKIKRISILFAFLFLFFAAHDFAVSEASPSFQLICPKGMASYAENQIMVFAPEAGDLRLEILDEYASYRILTQRVAPGENRIVWDGLGWNEERLNQKDYTFSAELRGDSGKTWTDSVRRHLETSAQALLFTLPSSEKLYLSDPDDWFLEFKMVLDDELIVEFDSEDGAEPVHSFHRKFSGSRINTCKLSAFWGSRDLKPGSYRVTCYAKTNARYQKEFRLTLLEGSRPVPAVTVTGPILPAAGATDAEIWEKMRMPSVVVDIAPASHQKVFAEPDTKSKSLGTLHGQTQALEVLEIDGTWAKVGAWNHESADYVEGWVPLKVLKAEEPHGDYGLLLDKKEQTLTVFYQGQRLDTLLVSTGRIEKGELYQETAAGSFLTDLHRADFSTNGLKYDFVIRYDGGNLLHQIPYAWGKEKKDYKAGEVYLGTKASHACVRIQAQPGAGGLNAYWLWTHLPYHSRVIILDDPEERAAEKAIVTGTTPALTDEGGKDEWHVVSDDVSDLDPEQYAVLTFGGDAVIGGREAYYRVSDSLPDLLSRFGAAYPFSRLASLFASDDLTCVNLECVLKDDALEEDQKKSWRFRGLTSYAEVLPESSIELVNLANNHTIDYGASGYASTLKALENQALVCGNEICTVVEIKGHLFGFGGCRETTYLSDPEVIERDIRSLRNQGAEFIIYQCHWGQEYSENHNKLQEAMARRCARAGVDLVVGHHPHVVQGISFIGDMPVVYSLGNLMFGGTIQLQTYDGLVLQVCFPLEGENGGRPVLKLIPILTSSAAHQRKNDYQPDLARGEDWLRILRSVQKDTAFRLSEKLVLEELP